VAGCSGPNPLFDSPAKGPRRCSPSTPRPHGRQIRRPRGWSRPAAAVPTRRPPGTPAPTRRCVAGGPSPLIDCGQSLGLRLRALGRRKPFFEILTRTAQAPAPDLAPLGAVLRLFRPTRAGETAVIRVRARRTYRACSSAPGLTFDGAGAALVDPISTRSASSGRLTPRRFLRDAHPGALTLRRSAPRPLTALRDGAVVSPPFSGFATAPCAARATCVLLVDVRPQPHGSAQNRQRVVAGPCLENGPRPSQHASTFRHRLGGPVKTDFHRTRCLPPVLGDPSTWRGSP